MKKLIRNFLNSIAVVLCIALLNPNAFGQCTIDNTCGGPYANVVIGEVSGDAGQSDGCEDGIVEIIGPPGAMIGCMVVTDTEWAVLIPPGTVIPADGVFMIGCSASLNENCGVGNPGQSGLIGGATTHCEGGGTEGDFTAGLLPELDFDTCDPANSSFYDPAASGFTLDNPGGDGNGDGEQVFLFLPDGTAWDGIVWDGGGTGGTDHASVSLYGVPYTLGDNDGNGVVNDNAGTVGGGRGDGGNATAVPILPTDAGCPCNTPTDPGTFTVPPITDPIWFSTGTEDHAGCNSSFIRGPLAGNGDSGNPSHTDGLITSTTLDASGQPIDNGGGLAAGTTGDAFTPSLYTPSSCGDPSAEWGYTDHPTPGQPNNDPHFVFYADVTSVCALTDPVNFCVEIYNWQNVSDGSINTGSGCDNVNTGSLVDFNGAVQTWDSYDVAGEQTTMCVQLSGWNPGTNVVGLVWDEWSNTNGTTGNPAQQGNPNECYETATFFIEAVEPLVATDTDIQCPDDNPQGAINIGNYVTGGSDLMYTLVPTVGATVGPQTSGGFILSTGEGPWTATVSDGSGCYPDVQITISDNCAFPPVCPENFATTVTDGDDDVFCPGETATLCFTADNVPVGGSLTWYSSTDGGANYDFIDQVTIPETPASPEASVYVSEILPNPAGDDCPQDCGGVACSDGTSFVNFDPFANPSGDGVTFGNVDNGEYLTITNAGTGSVNLGGYQAGDNDGTIEYIFPAGYMLCGGCTITIPMCSSSGGTGGNLANSGDDVLVTQPDGTVFWQTNYTSSSSGVPLTFTQDDNIVVDPPMGEALELCIDFEIPFANCGPTAQTYDFQAVVEPFDAACPLNDGSPDEPDNTIETSIIVSCPDAMIAGVFDVCEADSPGGIDIPVIVGGGTAPYSVEYAIDGTTQAPVIITATGDPINIPGPTNGEIKVALVSITDGNGAGCAGSVGTDEICVNIRPELDLTIASSTSPATCTPCDGTVTFDLSAGTSTNAFDIDYTIDGVVGSVSSVSMPYTLTGVCPGEFDIVGASDDAGCPATVTSSVQILTSPAGASLAVDAQPAAICDDGTFDIDLAVDATYAPSFSAADFQIFDVNPNALPANALANTPSPLIYSAADASTSTTISGITANATYYVQYTDPATGCQSVAPVDIVVDNSVCVQPVFDLALTKEVNTAVTPGPYEVGDPVTYTICVFNQGNEDATATQVTDYGANSVTNPAGGLNFVGLGATPATTTQGTAVSITQVGGPIFEIDALAADEDVCFDIDYTIDPNFAGGSLINDAEITQDSGDDIDSTPGDNPTDSPDPDDDSTDDGNGDPDTQDPSDDDYDPAEVTVVTPCPDITATLSGDGQICNSGTVDMSVEVTGGVAPYTIVINGDTIGSYNSGDAITVSPSETTTYVIVSILDANGCPGIVSGSAEVTVTMSCAEAGSLRRN